MDRAKAKLIVEAGLQEARCCATCGYWSPKKGWGTCELHSYVHGKHERVHYMPAAPTTVCDQWVEDAPSDVQRFLALARQVAEEE